MSSLILCKYFEGENGEVKLVRVDKVFKNELEVKEEVLRLHQEDMTARFVLLTELEVPTNSW